MTIDAEGHQLQHQLADQWAAIEGRLQAAEQKLCEQDKSTQPTADVAADGWSLTREGKQNSCRWSDLEARLLSIEQSLSLGACHSQVKPSQQQQPQQPAGLASSWPTQQAPSAPAAPQRASHASPDGALLAERHDEVPSSTQRCLATELTERGVPHTFQRVAEGYYSWSLEQRRAILGAASIQQLCKSMVMVNTRAATDTQRHFLIIIQYASSIQAEALKKHVIAFEAARGRTLSRKQCNMRLAAEAESTELTGFEHNAVSPVGLRTALPIVVAAEIAELPFIWLGGGEPDLKLCVPVPAFLAAYKPAIVACSDPKRTVEDT